MKTKIAFFSFALALGSFSKAQTFSCSDFSIVSTQQNTQNPNEVLLDIQFSAPSNTFVNYPYVAAVLNCNGDTVATGALNFFGQFGQSTQTYSVTLTGDFSCSPLTAVVAYMNSNNGEQDTCFIAFESTLNLTRKEQSQTKVNVFPNPVNDFVFIEMEGLIKDLKYVIASINGSIVLHGEMNAIKQKMDLSSLENGIYFFRLEGGFEPIKIMKR